MASQRLTEVEAHELGLALVRAADVNGRRHLGRSEIGALVLCPGVDQDHAEVHWLPAGGADGEGMVQRGIVVLTVALEAPRSSIGKAMADAH